MSITFILVGSLFGAFVLYTIYNFRKFKNTPVVASSAKIKELTAQNFIHQVKDGITLVDFWAEWCMPCKMMAPVLNDLVEDLYDGTGVGKLNVEHHQSIAAKYNVRNIPTLILFKNGKEINRFVGVKSKDFLLQQIQKA
jgi:thioredoxin 1